MKYFSYYDTQADRRLMSPAAVNKMNYICSLLDRNHKKTHIISCGMSTKKRYPKQRERLTKDTDIYYFPTIIRNQKSKLNRIKCKIYENVMLFSFIMKYVKRKETILVYHSLLYMRCFRLAKRLKKFKVVLEVEENYNDVISKSKFSRNTENKFIEEADAYIFSNSLLNDLYNKDKKPYLVIHGSYKIEKRIVQIQEKKKIDVVYAGTFDENKGVMFAIDAAKYLSEDYVMHIIGFGSERDIAKVKQRIEYISKTSKCHIQYDGLKTGIEYIEYIQKCDIGLSIQNPNAKFNNSSFPSKVLSYLVNGLAVVSIDIPAIKISEIANMVSFYDEQSPQKIAEAIQNVPIDNKMMIHNELDKLDKKMLKEMNWLYKKLGVK